MNTNFIPTKKRPFLREGWFFLFLIHFVWACNPGAEQKQVQVIPQEIRLAKEFIDQHNGYSEAVVVKQGNIKTIYISGQIGEGDNFEAQMRSAIQNLEKTLKKAGASMKDVVKMNTYIVDYEPTLLDTFRNVRKELLGDSQMPASTLVGVTSLALENWLIEIEAIAVVETSQ